MALIKRSWILLAVAGVFLVLCALCTWAVLSVWTARDVVEAVATGKMEESDGIRSLGGATRAAGRVGFVVRHSLCSEDGLQAGVRFLGHCGADARGELIRLLSHSDTCVQTEASRQLAQIGGGGDRVVAALLKALESSKWRVRGSAASALGSLGAREAIRPLSKALADPLHSVSLSASQALGKIGGTYPEGAQALADALPTARGKMIGCILKAMGVCGRKDLVQNVRPYLEHADPNIAFKAAVVLLQLGDSSGIQIVARKLGAPQYGFRMRAAEALGTPLAVAYTDQIIALLVDESLVVRRAAACSLGNIGNKTGMPALQKMANDSSEDATVRRAAREALVKIKKAQEDKKKAKSEKQPVEAPAK